MTSTERVDIAIIGAGPAGLTLASLVCRYRPQTRVVVLEKERLPRHKVGEGLIVDVNRVLADMGVLEAVEAEGFPRKYGSTFCWGAERQPRTFLFRDGQGLVGTPDGYQLDYTWHVDRPRYDQILADHARSLGAEIRTRHLVTGVVEGADGAVTGVVVQGPCGDESELAATWVIDAAGGRGPLTRSRGRRDVDAELRNIAIFAYHRRVGWREDLQGPPELRRTLILTHPRGWVWMIPVSADTVSVGFVTRLETWQAVRAEHGGELEPADWYREVLTELPEYAELLAEAELVDYRGDQRLVHTVQEFSYACDPIWGPGWALCGDASGFVDAILSIGCFVAQAHAQFLAYALISVLDGDCEPELALGSYATTARENLAAFRAITHMFYAFNSSRSDWWRDCAGLLRSSALVPDGLDREAFLAFVNGFSTRHGLYEEAVNSFGGMFLLGIGQSLFGDQQLFDGGAAEAAVREARSLVGADARLQLRVTPRVQAFALPQTGSGRLRPVTRVDLSSPGDAEAGQEIARRLFVPSPLADVPALLDGRLTLREIAAELVARGVIEDATGGLREVRKLAYRMARMGVLERSGSTDVRTGRDKEVSA